MEKSVHGEFRPWINQDMGTLVHVDNSPLKTQAIENQSWRIQVHKYLSPWRTHSMLNTDCVINSPWRNRVHVYLSTWKHKSTL